MKNNNISTDKLDSPFMKDVFKQEIMPKNPEKYNKKLNKNELNILNNVCKRYDYYEKKENKFNKIKNDKKVEINITMKKPFKDYDVGYLYEICS